MKKQLLFMLIVLLGFYMPKAQITMISSNGGAPVENRNFQTVTDWLHYDGDNNNRLGSTSSYTMGAYVKLNANLLTPHIGRQIEELQFFIGDVTKINGDLEIRFYTDLASSPVYTQTVSASSLTSMDWNTVVLTTPYQIINANDLYVGYYVDMQSSYIAGIDDGANFVSDVNYIVYNGTVYEMGASGFPDNLNVRAGVGGATSANDCGISNINMNDIILEGSQPIEATITNYGSNSLSQIDVNYSVDGGTPITETLSGLNVATGASNTFTFSTPWNAMGGNHIIDVWVSNFNGNGADDIAANDHQTKTVQVATQSTQNMPLYEEFTSSTCSPCAQFNSQSFNHNFLTTNAGKYNLIKYQMNWPGSGDIYYTAEGGVRKDYYAVGAVPDLLLDGEEDTFFDANGLQADLDAAYAEPAYFGMNSTYQVDANNNVNVAVHIVPYLNGNYTLHCAVVEKVTTGNVGTNGETQFYNVMMKMVPDAGGTNASLAIGQPMDFNLTSSLNGTNIEEYTDLEVVVFLQDDNNKNVMQSAKAVEQTNTITNEVLNNINTYPNPANNFVAIQGAKGMDVEILNITGAVIIKKNNISGMENINTSNLIPGIYLIKFIKGKNYGIKKLIIN